MYEKYSLPRMIHPTRDNAVPVKGNGLSAIGQKSTALSGVPSGGQLLNEAPHAATQPGLSISMSRLSRSSCRNHSNLLSHNQELAVGLQNND